MNFLTINYVRTTSLPAGISAESSYLVCLVQTFSTGSLPPRPERSRVMSELRRLNPDDNDYAVIISPWELQALIHTCPWCFLVCPQGG